MSTKKFRVCSRQEDLEEQIIFLTEDLKRRIKDISADWNKSVDSIYISSRLAPNEVLKWEIKKTYLAYKEE